ncbi:MAG: ADP-ribosylation factor-like protein [Candidatus Flexifilum sp.]
MSSPSLLERLFIAVFGTAGRNFVTRVTDSVSQASNRLSDFVYVRMFGLPFIVLGARQTGKTTLIEWLRRNVTALGEFNPAPTAPGGDPVGSFNAHIGDERIRLKPTRDVGGEYSMWETDWTELFRETTPRGLIFLIDHTDVLTHKDALNFVLNLIEEEEAARRNLRSFLLLVNKSDLWQAGMPLDKLMLPYSNEIKRLNNQAARLGYRVKIQSVSVINGTGVDDAMRAFFNTIRPLPRPGVS